MGNTPAQKETIRLMEASHDKLSMEDQIKKHDIDKHVERGNKEIQAEKKPLKGYQALAKAKSKKGKMVKVMGHEVREGSKKHANLVAEKKLYDDLASSER